ncbi:5-dehydro-4-deoxy-D-glucuronate isomerase [Halalkalibacterium halodurans]|jgi:4-deoxy-L-threo-5-hexosulose-uronate ketol-isomerase|uniref:4-deoxy-L-threo-5-hexosulose-uronate ketol-isomerase n=2 Tax=Halalkalibacterium halodurans TaxID=86665 RepID=KDUI_HALH5|nr:5-dehydro-4-deoxy-D-glucuronate isomerase [Halalkalibacterium halodurans]Q9KAX0.1 RecName: Full=4-deoxy-L-threo-5-hexosulose-uronate ketol-isomerase; AltName: Full=5-keto-4-deoxyuronate isomerase; AltName: Full=DKI isomerase [Halalkalibacterium halodurans C-125]MDY7222722.1 5-dehydro-4-deoxy-D-glucuronate isomerase [Halalkalibacterium halodurans]MDY7241943.1 5-dehydro-4-deoxy-D-glucuronate isomerase [Halalkalibacterium halodurans]MED4082986.1 5-dehydro-4-deoxy-D-glucuronate isomerase [Halalk
MENRYATSPEDVKRYTTDKLRQEFLVESLFTPGEIQMVYTHFDRTVIGGAIPMKEPLALDAGDFLKTDYFLERREVGIINIGPKGKVIVDGDEYTLNKRDCLYIGLGKRDVSFHSEDSSNPARFYFVSALAHHEYPTKVLPIEEAVPTKLGSDAESNNRTIYKYIHSEGIQSCQLMMGMTLLEPNNMWNTMPAHIHDRRNEVYLYFDMEDDSRVFHFMGQPHETRHLVVKNEQAVISPPWSIHSGVGTANYTFIWAMAGENYTFTDMEFIKMEDLR